MKYKTLSQFVESGLYLALVQVTKFPVQRIYFQITLRIRISICILHYGIVQV